ncbi:hypothetical protein Cfor_11056 [Coptotermes formosanus]|uniref:Ubiquitin-like domain-containing protein n=1 Tax=Coptotermes formosanus TaxID=36987 RepID=A0A6L2PRQ5_COPFO|nr:hypothetical protein Cfor_11056 [Coptotermes formosanus]
MDTGGGNAGSSDAAKTNPNSTSETSQHSGCGCTSGTTITVRVTPTTGGQFDLQVAKTESVENLKKLISKKLKMPKERICLLHRDRQLRDGTLQENQLMDGSRLTLLPSVETGLLAQRPEQSVMQALESLNDSQVNDFLSGKAPLNLTMRLGDHMMLIQLQLSTVTPSSSRRLTNTNSNTNTSTASTNCSSTHSPLPVLPATTSALPVAGSNNTTFCNTPGTSQSTMVQPAVDSRCSNSNSASDPAAPQRHSSPPKIQTCSKANTSLSQINVSAASPSPLLVSSRNSGMTASQLSVMSSGKNASHSTSTDSHRHHSQQKASQQNPSAVSVASESAKVSVSSSSTTGLKSSTPASVPTRPFTSFYTKSSTSNSDSSEVAKSSSISESSHRTVQHLVQSPLKSLENATNNVSVYTGTNSSNVKLPVSQTAPNNTLTTSSSHGPFTSTSVHACTSASLTSSSSSTMSTSALCKCEPTTAAKPTLDTRALAEASRNLTQTLKQLSSEVLTSRSDPAEDSARTRRQGAIIESMHHHGKGVYSGTFSGTLNPALQDRFGRPKRDISTIIHILNDLLCATPQYRRHARQGHTITLEASSSSPAKSGSSGGSNLVSVDSRTGHNVDFMEESLTLSQENQATRGKMEQLRLIMQERRARRRARREARLAPYTLTQWSAKSESLSTQQNPAGGTGSLGTHGDEPMDTAGSGTAEQHVCELNPPEPVVA